MIHLLLSIFIFVELNCENLFDCNHDEGKNDTEYCEGGSRRWNYGRYYHKLRNIAKELTACGGKGESWSAPDLVALVEIENDSVMTGLTKRSPLRKLGYEYIMTQSPDQRGIDVALMYNPLTFTVINHHSIRVTPLPGMKPTRDILYCHGTFHGKDSTVTATPFDDLHIYVVHAPSRTGGETVSEPFRLHVSEALCSSIDSLYSVNPDAQIIVAGDFNDYHTNRSLMRLAEHGMHNISATATGHTAAMGTYKYNGIWDSLDHILISQALYKAVGSISDCYIFDDPFVLEEDSKYGGYRPSRTYSGFHYNDNGFSDHLPLIFRCE